MVMENTRLVLSRPKHAKKISSALLHNHQYSEPLMQGRMDPYTILLPHDPHVTAETESQQNTQHFSLLLNQMLNNYIKINLI